MLMGASFDYAALFHNHYAVGVAYRGKTVGYHKGGAACHQGVHSTLYEGFSARVYGGSGFVKDKHRRIGYRGTGDG